MGADIDWAAELDKAATPNRVCSALARALDAQTVGKDGNPTPDYRTQLQAALGYLAHRRGRPAEAPEPKPSSDRKAGMADLLALLEDPEVVARIEEIKARQAGND